MYIELHTASAFSFLDGASLPAALIERAASLGYPALALLDRDGVYGAPQFYRAARAAGLKAIVGAELTMAPVPPGADGRERTARAARSAASVQPGWPLPVLVASAEGYRNLCRLITAAKAGVLKGEGRVSMADLAGRTGGLIALVGRDAMRAGCEDVSGMTSRLGELFGAGQVWIELQRHLRREDPGDLQQLRDLAAACRLPVMASNGVRFATPEARPVYDVLTSPAA